MPLQRTAIGAQGIGALFQAEGEKRQIISPAYWAMDFVAAKGQEANPFSQERGNKELYVFYSLAKWHFERFVELYGPRY